MSVSVVTVALNAAEDLPLTIESVRQQEYRDIELIVVDGGSYDATASVLALYADVIDKVVRVEDAGIYHAMNIALDHCSKEYVLFLNAKDTLFTAATLARMMTCKRPQVDVFFGNHIYVEGRREYFKQAYEYPLAARLLHDGKVDHAWLARLPGHQATFVRLDLLRRLRFNTDIEISADHDVMMRAYRAGASFQYIDETVSHYVGGGFSAVRPGRLMLEWCALYREYSADPAAVDRFFLGDNPSPFGPQNALTGVCVAGDYPREGPYPDRGMPKPISWCRPDGTRLRTPAHRSSTALKIEGFCPFDEQRLALFCGDENVATLHLAKGWFRQTVTFTRELRSATLVEIAAIQFGQVSAGDPRMAGFALASFAFEVADETAPLACGDRIAFSSRNRALTARMLGDGWDEQEEEHIWNVGKIAELRLRLSPDVKTIVLRCMGNPFIDDAALRGADVTIDEKSLGRHLLERDVPSEWLLPCAELETRGTIRIALHPLLRQCTPSDARTLGICLLALECR